MGNTALKRRVAPARRVKVLPVTKRHDGDGEESRNGPDGGFHVTIQTPVPTITDTLQYSEESRQKKPPLDLKLAHTAEPSAGRRSRSGTFGSTDVGVSDHMESPVNYKTFVLGESTSNGVGRRSRSNTQNSTMTVMSPVAKTPVSRSRSNTVDSARGLDAAVCADASAKAVTKLRDILSKLDKGETPDSRSLKNTLRYAADLLSSISEQNSPVDGPSDASLQLVDDAEVRAWLTSTFTRKDSLYEQPSQGLKRTFKAVADAVIIGQYLGKMADNYHITYPVSVAEFFEEQVDSWNCNMFKLEELTDVQPLRFTGYHLFKHHQLLEEYKISKSSLDAFLCRVEEAYQLHSNPYHNSTHAADVLQTVHCLITSTKLSEWLTKLELLALLFAATIHDIEHTGTTNSYHVQTYSDMALCYNDRSVLENYHLYKAFSLLKEDDLNIFRGLNLDQFRQVRSLVIDMVLATDMSNHFDHLKHMKRLLSSSDAMKQIEGSEKSKFLCQVLHMADISHPGKTWEVHQKWTLRLMDEFFKQGDMQRENGYPCSPLCDRNTTAIPESQIGFIEIIVGPAFEVFGEMLELVVHRRHTNSEVRLTDNESKDKEKKSLRIWASHLTENKRKWIDISKPKGLKDRDDVKTTHKHCNGDTAEKSNSREQNSTTTTANTTNTTTECDAEPR